MKLIDICMNVTWK